MPTETATAAGSKERKDESGHGRHHKERIGNYIVGAEIGRGSFATVYKGYRSKTRDPIAIKAVSRQKLTTKLLENLESEINILKAISHRNITALEDCFKNDTHIYLVMEFCSGSDLSFYIKNRGRLPTLDYVPRGSLDSDKVFFPHPPTGGLDERVTRCFLGQLVHAVEFLRKQNLIHRDIKPQNLLLQPASDTDIAMGHPLGIPLLKVADFGFARILPASAMAETLCGSPLYMAPEILRYEKYDAKVDLWSVGAVLFEMAVGKPPFRASNHVELLRKIEKGEDRIKFPDESSRSAADPDAIPPLPVPSDIKGLIRGLLKRHSADRMSFEAFFGSRSIWESHMIESHSTDDSMDLEVSTDSSSTGQSGRIQELIASAEEAQTARAVPTHAPQPIATEPALNPQPARVRSDLERRRAEVAPAAVQTQVVRPTPIRRTMPKYYVQDDTPPPSAPEASAPNPVAPVPVTPVETPQSHPRPIRTTSQPIRRYSGREPASIEEAQPITPGSNNPAPVHRTRVLGEGSPLAATPPITMSSTGKDESALEGDDSIVGREYVVIEKRTVEVNALADEVDQASRKPSSTLARRPSSRTSVVSRPVSAFKPATQPLTNTTSTSPRLINNQAVVPMSYSPPFGLSSTPPFAIPPVSRQTSGTPAQIGRNPSIPSSLNVFPPAQIYDTAVRYGSSPSSLQTGTLARALTNTALRLIGTSANAATNAITRATSGSTRRPTIARTGDMDREEEELLRKVEDIARKAFALFELADSRLSIWQHLAASAQANDRSVSPNRRSSSSSVNSEVLILRQQEAVAGEATNLLCKALAFIVKGIRTIQEYWTLQNTRGGQGLSQELNDMVQWLRARFNECLEKVEFAKSKSAEEMPFVDTLIHDQAKEASKQGAAAEYEGQLGAAEAIYENAIWLLQTLMDDVMYDGGHVREEDKAAYDRFVHLIQLRLDELRRKIESTNNAANATNDTASAGIMAHE